MKHLRIYLLLFALTMLSSCTIVTGIFKAGMGFGIFLVVLVIVFVIALVTRLNKKQ